MERTILLVDDEDDICSALSRLLRRDSYKILRAKNAREGLALLTEHEVGVVISDQRMSGMTGVEFLTQVRTLYPHTIRIILSGYADIEAVMSAINHGAIYKFFTKPWDNEVLRIEVLEAFRHHELVLEKEQLMEEIQAANHLLAEVNQEWVEAVAQRDLQIRHVSNYSALTDLPNRLMLLERLKQDMARAQRDDTLLAVVCINLDQFKQINDSFGHFSGDMLLQAVAQMLTQHARASDTVAHMGADEFCFLLPDIRSAQALADFAQRVIQSFKNAPILIGSSEVFANICIGIAIYPLDGVDADMLLRNADAALHHAKEDGQGGFQYYTPRMNDTAWQHLALETEMHRALERDEFVLQYQPRVSLATGKIAGMEALLCWQNTDRGLTVSGEFMPLLEKTGLILPVGAWAIDTACRQAALWQGAGLHPIQIAVNLSVMQLKDPGFAGTVKTILDRHCIDGKTAILELELTESLLMKDMDGMTRILGALREMGVRLSIDDFGSGYSCLSSLKYLPINSLKIAPSFVRHLPENRENLAILNAIVALGKGLGLNVIVDGVETAAQLACLRDTGCDEAQGFLFSRPVSESQMTRLLQGGEVSDLVMEE
ncbi:MAG: EAL domain-containing protein [Proteobacteria bacterium]|nr:EAL domain-containing protein [Pseudomonadota bacterium]